MSRAKKLAGVRLDELASSVAFVVDGEAVRTKGKVGELLERALGATGAGAQMDFPDLEVEMKTVPLEAGKPAESTFVCALQLMDAERASWETSWVRKKLSRVLWVPVVRKRTAGESAGPAEEREAYFGEPLLWSPTLEQERILAGDFDEVLGRIGAGGIEGVTAHVGRWLQLRPKAAHGRVRTVVRAAEGDLVATVPRGFYLRAKFVGAVLRDVRALP